jgi:hypothetical protein
MSTDNSFSAEKPYVSDRMMAHLFERIAPPWAQSKITLALSSGQSDRKNGGFCAMITQNENGGEKRRCHPPRPTRVPLRLRARSSRMEL